MAIPPYVQALRAHVGHGLLWFATARVVTVDAEGAILLGRYPGDESWSLPGGFIDPGEQPADAAIRECYEETGVIAIPEALSSISVSGLVTHDSGDLTQHLDLTFRCRSAGGSARPGDGEFEAVRWHRADALPPLSSYDAGLIAAALACSERAAFTFSGLAEVIADRSQKRGLDAPPRPARTPRLS